MSDASRDPLSESADLQQGRSGVSDALAEELHALSLAALQGTAGDEELSRLDQLACESAAARRYLACSLQTCTHLRRLAAAQERSAQTAAQRLTTSLPPRPPVLGFLHGITHLGGDTPLVTALTTWAVMTVLCSGIVLTIFFCALLIFHGIGANGRNDAPPGVPAQRDGAFAGAPANALPSSSAGKEAADGTGDRNGSRPAPQSSATVARLVHTYDCRWATGSHSPRAGDDLEPGRQLVLLSGLAEVIFQSGVRTVLQGPTTLEVASKTGASLRQGRLTVEVIDPDARGFEVRTPGMKYTDLGTEFGVYVGRDGSQEMHVFRGQVRAEQVEARGQRSEVKDQKPRDPRPPISDFRLLTSPILLSAHQAIRVGALGKPIEHRTADEGAFVRAEQMKQMVIEQSPEWRRWKQFSVELSKRQELIAYYDFQPEGDRSILRNRAATGPQFDGRLVGGAEWCEGRFPGKQAVQFVKLHSGVRVNIPLDCKEITLMTWMKVDRLSRPLAALLNSAGAGRPNAFHWQITRPGKLEFTPYVSSQAGTSSGVESDDAVKAASRQWASTALVYDSATGKIAFYYDGSPAGATTLAAKAAGAARLGEGTIGGWDPQEYSFGDRDRPLNGRIDEMMIFNKALSAEEIRKIHEATQP